MPNKTRSTSVDPHNELVSCHWIVVLLILRVLPISLDHHICHIPCSWLFSIRVRTRLDWRGTHPATISVITFDKSRLPNNGSHNGGMWTFRKLNTELEHVLLQ